MHKASNIFITAVHNDLNINMVEGSGRVVLISKEGGIYNHGHGDGANIYGENVVLEVEKGIGNEGTPILTDITRDGSITIFASDDIFVSEILGDMRVATIQTDEDIELIAQGSIINAGTNQINLSGFNLTLQALTGTIGMVHDLLTINILEGGHFRANTGNKGIYVYSVDGDLIVDWIYAGDAPVVLRSKGSILDGLADGSKANIIASTLRIQTETGNIGSAPLGDINRSIRLDLVNESRIDIDVAGSVYLIELTGDMSLGVIKVQGDQFVLIVPGNIYTSLTQDDILEGTANIEAKEVHIISLYGSIGRDTNKNESIFDEDYVGWITTYRDGAYKLFARAAGDIYIRELAYDLIVGEVVSINGDVSLSAYMDVKSHNDEGSKTANVTGENIYIETTYGIISLNVMANGDVILNSYDRITNLRQEGIGDILITGRNITLISRNGGVGQDDSYIELDTTEGGVLNVYAHEGVYIREIYGDLIVGKVISTIGDVELEVISGSILRVQNDEDHIISGKNIRLVSLMGGIGGEDSHIAIDSQGRIEMI